MFPGIAEHRPLTPDELRPPLLTHPPLRVLGDLRLDPLRGGHHRQLVACLSICQEGWNPPPLPVRLPGVLTAGILPCKPVLAQWRAVERHHPQPALRGQRGPHCPPGRLLHPGRLDHVQQIDSCAHQVLRVLCRPDVDVRPVPQLHEHRLGVDDADSLALGNHPLQVEPQLICQGVRREDEPDNHPGVEEQATRAGAGSGQGPAPPQHVHDADPVLPPAAMGDQNTPLRPRGQELLLPPVWPHPQHRFPRRGDQELLLQRLRRCLV